MKDDEMDPRLKNTLGELQAVSPRDPQKAAYGRANFLKQASVLRRASLRKTDQHPSLWKNALSTLFPTKERLPVWNGLVAVLLAVAIFFGGTAATVYAAQDSLPGQALYPLKTWSEDTILSLAENPRVGLEYALDFSDRRVTEISGLLSAGNDIPLGVEARLRNELDLLLELAAGMGDLGAIQQLEQIRQRAEAQLQTISLLMEDAPQSQLPILGMSQARLQEQVQLTAGGITDLQGFRLRVQERSTQGEPTPGIGDGSPGSGPFHTNMTPTPSGTGPDTHGNHPTGTPGQNGQGSQTPDWTPHPGGSSGQGP